MNHLRIAHRGASYDYPENTLLSFRRAIEMGVDYLELWPPDSVEEISRMLALNVEGIVTDRPDILNEILHVNRDLLAASRESSSV